MRRLKYTPENIDHLESGEIFVFGSNLEGHHDGGAAKYALDNFGAIYGKGVGLQGRSYAIPTMESLKTLQLYALDFIEYAQKHKELFFCLTKVGCGIAGYKEEEVAGFFRNTPDNVIKPKGW